MPQPCNDGSAAPLRYGLVVPVKRAAVAKSRLSSLGDRTRRDLVAAFAVDTVRAALDCGAVEQVLVVTDDVPLATRLADLGALAIPDGSSGQLNTTLRLGAVELLRRHPPLRPVALCADLPSLRSDELTEVLMQVPPEGAAFLPDAAGTGTTLYTASTLDLFRPRFGPGSRRAHASAGAVELLGRPVPSVRRDVDTPDDLRDAALLGLGAATSAAVRDLSLRMDS